MATHHLVYLSQSWEVEVSKVELDSKHNVCCYCGKCFEPPGSTTNRNNICSDSCDERYWERFGQQHGVKVVTNQEKSDG
jgi:hypothetical protein